MKIVLQLTIRIQIGLRMNLNGTRDLWRFKQVGDKEEEMPF